MDSLEPLPVLALGVRQTGQPAASSNSCRGRLRGLLRQACASLQQAALPLPWLVCLLGLQAGAAGAGPGLDGAWGLSRLWEQQLALFLGLLLLFASGAASLKDRLRSGGGTADLGPLLAALALLFWHLGLQQAPGCSASSPSLRRCVALVKSIGLGSHATYCALDDRHAAVGLMLLDDVLRAVLRFVGATPAEAWPFAIANQRTRDVWVHDEEWWRACYHGASWMRLPTYPQLPFCAGSRGAQPPPPRPGGAGVTLRQLLREATLWASMMAQTLGTVVMLRPKCAAPSWAMAPCVASTLLVASCAAWLPRQSDMVLVEMFRLLRIVGKFAVYFQAIWIAAAGLLVSPDELALCALPKDAWIPLRSLEVGAVMVLYVMVAGHLWAVAARCRAASPLYAVSAEDFVMQPPLRSRPLYCGTLGLVEGTYAPTAMCDWEELAGTPEVRWRDCFAIRHCAEVLAAREAHLLSYLDALRLRIDEAEMEAHSSTSSSSWLPGGCAGAGTAHPSAFGPWRKLGGLLAIPALLLCVVVGRVCASTLHVHQIARPGPRGIVELTLWAALLLRVGHGWYSIMAHSVAAWTAAGREAYSEAAELRQRLCTVHRSLAEAQWLIRRVEDRLTDLVVAPQPPGPGSLTNNFSCTASTRGAANDGCAGDGSSGASGGAFGGGRGGGGSLRSGGVGGGTPGSVRALLALWTVCLFAPMLLPRDW